MPIYSCRYLLSARTHSTVFLSSARSPPPLLVVVLLGVVAALVDEDFRVFFSQDSFSGLLGDGDAPTGDAGR